MVRDQEKNIARIAGIILFLGGIIIISMSASKAIDSNNNFYYAIGTLFLVTGVYLFSAHYFQDLNLELAFYITFMSFLLTFALCFTKAYDDITSEKDLIFVPGINDEGIAVIGMSVFYTLFFVFLFLFIYRKINIKREIKSGSGLSIKDRLEKYKLDLISDKNISNEKIENIEKDVENIENQDKYKDKINKIKQLIDYRVRLNSKNLENYPDPDDFRDLGPPFF